MSTVANLFKLFRGETDTAMETGGRVHTSSNGRGTRSSSGLAEFNKRIAASEGLAVLDLGPTSPQNISTLTGMGHRVYNEDVLLASLDPQFVAKNDDGTESVNVEAFLAENLKYEPGQFDAVLAWDVPDYLHESLVRPMVDRIASMLKPGGVMLAYFHTKDAGPDAPYYRYHIAGQDLLELQRGPQFQLQRVFNNRHIENLFKDFNSLKFFLARDNVREVLVLR
jgi:2-polyprenyl-3-methyl-5-hydroxy-6-metoxy-1,4-benzoquinol methylase